MSNSGNEGPQEGSGPGLASRLGWLVWWLRALLADRGFRLALLAGAVVRVLLCSLPGTSDVDLFIRAGALALDYGTRMFDPALKGPDAILLYPPGSFFLYGAVEAVARIAPSWIPRPFFYNLFTCVFLAAVLTQLYRRIVDSSGIGPARLAVLAVWLNPAVLLNSPVLGYADPLYGGVLCMAVLVAAGRQWGWAGMLLGASVTVKPTGLILVPLLATLAVRRGGFQGLAVAASATVSTICALFLPFAIAGTLHQASAVASGLFRSEGLSCLAFNFWWIVQWVIQLLAKAQSLGAIAALIDVRTAILPRGSISELTRVPYYVISLGLVGIATWSLCCRLWKLTARQDCQDGSALLEAAALQYASYFALAHGVHENHLWPICLFLPVAWALRRPARVESAEAGDLVALSALMALNLATFYGLGEHGEASRIVHSLLRPNGLPDSTVLFSLLNLFFLLRLMRRQPASREAEPYLK